MIPFFRKIRWRLAKNNQFFKYSRYAIGEIVLVVVGILIALQINTWNEDMKSQIKFELLLKEAQKEILVNIIKCGEMVDYYSRKDSIFDLVINDKLTYEDYKSRSFNYLDLITNNKHANLSNDAYLNLINFDIKLTNKQDSIIKILKKTNADNKSIIDIYDLKMENLALTTLNDLKREKEWFANTVDRTIDLNDEAINYFLNDPFYLNEVWNYSIMAFENHLNSIVKYRYNSLKVYDLISQYFGLSNETRFFANFNNYQHLIGNYKTGNNLFCIVNKKGVLKITDHPENRNYTADSLNIFPISKNKFTVENQRLFYLVLYNENSDVIKLKTHNRKNDQFADKVK